MCPNTIKVDDVEPVSQMQPTPQLIKQTPAALWEERIAEPIRRMGLRFDDKFPLRRDNKIPYVRNGEKIFPPYECITTNSREEFCFGYPIVKITPQTLIEACSDGTIDNSSHREQHIKYEYDGELRPGPRRVEYSKLTHIPGYCSTGGCRNKGLHALPAGQYCRYHCADCMAGFMNVAYAKDELGICAVFCMPDINELEDYGTVATSSSRLEIKFSDGFVQTNNTNLKGFFVQVAPRVHERGSQLYWNLPWMLVITTPFIHTTNTAKGSKPQSSIYLGLYRGHIRGRYVCRNIALGLPCRSESRVKKYHRFCERVVPSHYPGWEESGPGSDWPSLVTTHQLCWSCDPPVGRDATLEYMRVLHEDLMARDETYRSGDMKTQRVMLLEAMNEDS